VQTKDDGKHAILPAADRSDRARVPVMMPRESNGKMRRGGSNAARMQPHHPADERGRVHGVPELSFDVEQRVTEKTIVHLNVGSEKRRWRKRRQPTARLGGQDKSRKVLGGRMIRKSRNNNARGKGVPISITLLHATTRWKRCKLDTLQFDVP
jgi:hypothetical protein